MMPASLRFLFSYKTVIHIRVKAAACWVLPLQRATRHPCGQELEGTLQLPLFPRSPGKAVGCRSSWEHPCFLWSWDGLSAALGWLLVAFRISWPPLFSQDSVLCPAPAPSLSVHRRLPWFVVAPLNATEQKLPCSISYSLCFFYYSVFCYFMLVFIWHALSALPACVLQGRSSRWPKEACVGHSREKSG